MNGAQDLGGMMGFGPVVPEPVKPLFHANWEPRAFALTLAMGATGEWTIDMARFGFPKVDSSQVFEVARLGPGGAREPQGSFKASAVSFKGVLAARDVLMLVISKANLGMLA